MKEIFLNNYECYGYRRVKQELSKSYDVIPPKVEYSLTDKGESLMKVLDELCKWGEENKNKH